MTILVLSTCAFCVIATVLHLASIATVLQRVRRSAAEVNGAKTLEGISIIRPVCGVENFSEETLLSGFHLDYPRYELLFCAAQASDPVVPLVRRLIELHPHVPARLLIGNECISANPKLNNVVKGWVATSYPWIVMADSNVLMPPDYLHRLLATWRADTALVSSPAIGCSPGNMWAELECAFLNTYQARWQCFADSRGMGFAQGKTMLFHRDLLASAGGIRAFAFEAAEDAAATKVVRKTGLRVRVVDRPFPQPLGQRTAAEVWRRQLRWARLRRNTFRIYFLPEIGAGALPPCGLCHSSRGQRLAAGGRADRLRHHLVRRRGRSDLRCRLASILAIAVVVAVARSSVAGPLVGKLARQWLCVARHPHARPQPRLGRVAAASACETTVAAPLPIGGEDGRIVLMLRASKRS
jgi:ceramide glucosyltransferase